EDAITLMTRDLEQYTDDLRSAITRCVNRARERLASFEAAFAPIRDKAVPERIVMQARIQEYQSLIGTIDGILRDWAEWPASAQGAPPPTPTSGSSAPFGVRPAKKSGGVRAGLIAIPIVAAALGFGAYKTLGKGGAPAADAPAGNAAQTAAPSPATPAA